MGSGHPEHRPPARPRLPLRFPLPAVGCARPRDPPQACAGVKEPLPGAGIEAHVACVVSQALGASEGVPLSPVSVSLKGQQAAKFIGEKVLCLTQITNLQAKRLRLCYLFL